MKYKKILIFLITFIIILSCALITFIILSNNTQNVSNDTVEENMSDTENIYQNIIQEDVNQENTIEDSNTSQEENIQINETKQNDATDSSDTVNNIANNEEIRSEEDTEVNEESKKNKDQIATDLAKNEWGDDESVYYTIDKSSGDKYYICVRSKATTETLAEYEVDIGKKTVEIK